MDVTHDIRRFLEKFPREATVGQLLDAMETADDWIREADIRCARPGCGRLITELGSGRWVHVAPGGQRNHSCKSASFDDPKPGDTDQGEWLNWPRDRERQQAYPGRNF